MARPNLRDKRIVIVGGSSGIGLAVGHAALAEGGQVVIGSSKLPSVERALAQLGEGASGSVVSADCEIDLGRFFSTVGAFDHLVYTAGDWTGAGAGSVADLDIAAAADAFKIRFWGALAAVKQAQPYIRLGGSITLTNGHYAHRAPAGTAVVGAMLGGVEHLARGLAVDLAPLRVNAVCPSLVLTENNKAIPNDILESFAATTLLGRVADPSEVAEAYIYLMKGTYTTGQVLHVEGGGALR